MIRTTKIILGISFLILAVSVTALLVGKLPLTSKGFYASVNVTDSLGFDLNGSALTFGNVFRGGHSSRNLVFKNDFGFPVRVVAESSGDISEFLAYEDAIFVGPYEDVQIPVGVNIPDDADKRFYSGEIVLKIYRA